MKTTTVQQKWLDFLGNNADLSCSLGDGVYPSAHDYITAGVDPKTFQRWYAIGAWDIDSAFELETLEASGEISFDELAELTDVAGYNATLAYTYCNRDISLENIVEILGGLE